MLDKIKRIIAEGDVVPLTRKLTPDQLIGLRGHVLLHNGKEHEIYSVQISGINQRVIHASPIDDPQKMVSILKGKEEKVEVKPYVRNP